MKLATDDGDERHRLVLAALLGTIAVAGVADVILDFTGTPDVVHVAFEVLLLAVALGAVGYLGVTQIRARRAVTRMLTTSAADHVERNHWRGRAEKLLHGLGEEIDAQLGSWHLTRAERETALFLLKGYSHKEIAGLLGKSERTVRQHAVAVYRKSNLPGRAQLSAFFLEGLLLPSVGTHASRQEAGEEPGPGRWGKCVSRSDPMESDSSRSSGD